MMSTRAIAVGTASQADSHIYTVASMSPDAAFLDLVDAPIPASPATPPEPIAAEGAATALQLASKKY